MQLPFPLSFAFRICWGLDSISYIIVTSIRNNTMSCKYKVLERGLIPVLELHFHVELKCDQVLNQSSEGEKAQWQQVQCLCQYSAPVASYQNIIITLEPTLDGQLDSSFNSATQYLLSLKQSFSDFSVLYSRPAMFVWSVGGIRWPPEICQL